MSAIGNYEVIENTFGPFILAAGPQSGTIALPAGKVALGVSTTVDADRGTVFAQAAPSADGSEVNWRTVGDGAGAHSITVHITCAEMGC